MDPSDLAALATLDALLQEGSVTRAARRLGLSVPAVSHALARLRERFKDPLLVRAGRGMVLTPRAEELRSSVRAAVTLAGSVFEEPVAFEPDAVNRSFVVSMTDYMMLIYGVDLDARIAGSAPGLGLRVVPNMVDDAQRLRAGDTDLVIGIYGDLPPELRVRPVVTDRFVCVVRAGHPTVTDSVTLDEFVALQHVQVSPRGQTGGYLDDQLADRGLTRRIARAVPYFQVALELVAGSDRILTVSERIARKLGPALKLNIIEPPLALQPFALSMVWHPRFDADQAHRWLREQILATTSATGGIEHQNARRQLDPSDPTTGWAQRRR
jgi:DNA-binding transcriptional LysR family regulator